jgi:error-prone DNA polymerase
LNPNSKSQISNLKSQISNLKSQIPPTYTPLFCKSNYAFLEGASHPDELVAMAHELGLPALAVTDRDGVYGIVRAHMRAKELGFHLIIGAEITVEDGTTIVLLVMNRWGYGQLCRLISVGRLRRPKGESRVSWNEICQHHQGLIALWGGSRSALLERDSPIETARQLKAAFGDRLYTLLTRHHETRDAFFEHRVRERARRYDIPTVASMEVLYHHPARRPLQDVMTCIRHGVNLGTAGTLLQSNAEHALKSPDAFARLYHDDPASIARSNEIASRCTFSLDEICYRYPSEKLPDGSTTADWLRELTFVGAQSR